MVMLKKYLTAFCGAVVFAVLMSAGDPVLADEATVPFRSLKDGVPYSVRPDRLLKLEGTARDLLLGANSLKSLEASLLVDGDATERLSVTVNGDGDRWSVDVPPLKDPGKHATLQVVAIAIDGTEKTVDRAIETPTTPPAGCQPGDICKYFGLDVGAHWLPARDELRKVFTVNIYPDKVGRLPSEQFATWERLSVAVSYDVGDISGNNQSAIRDNHNYSIGIGYRLNRYFRVGTGLSLYRHADDNDLRRALYLSLSVDLTGFKVIEDLVKIDPN
jgi:hypothetical protein